jgi:integrase
MAARQRLGLRQVWALEPGEVAWDPTLPGFGARRQKGNVVSFIVKYRTAQGRQRWHTIGRFGAMTPDQARREAVKLLGEVADGGDPSADKQAGREATTVGGLCDQYCADMAAKRVLTRKGTPKKPSTVSSDISRIQYHIRPLLGSVKVAAVTRVDVERFMHDVAAGKTATKAKASKTRTRQGAASRTVNLLSAIFGYAIERRMRPDNPCAGVRRFADGRRERRLADNEYATLGVALREAEDANNVWPSAIAATKLIAVTGWRSGEALALKWSDLDLTRRIAILPDTKTGRSVRVLSRAACDLLCDQPKMGPLVFPAARDNASRMAGGYRKAWNRLMKGKLSPTITPHVLRHSFASLAHDLGYSELLIAALLGHAATTVTSRYTHAADAVLLAAADAVANRTAELMNCLKVGAEVILLRRELTS